MANNDVEMFHAQRLQRFAEWSELDLPADQQPALAKGARALARKSPVAVDGAFFRIIKRATHDPADDWGERRSGIPLIHPGGYTRSAAGVKIDLQFGSWRGGVAGFFLRKNSAGGKAQKK